MAAVPHSAFEYSVYMSAFPLESLHDEIRKGKYFLDFMGINATSWVEEVWFDLLTRNDFWNWNPSCVQMLEYAYCKKCEISLQGSIYVELSYHEK